MKNSHHPKLMFVGEPFDGRTYEFEMEKTTVGRSSQSNLCLQDASVSGRHCEILVHGAEVIIRDLDSSNGTYVNGARVNGQAQVKNGQMIRIGNVNARLELADAGFDESASDISAVHLHAKYMREAEEGKNASPPSPAQATFQAGADRPPSEHTVTMQPRPAGPAARDPRPTALIGESKVPPRRSSVGKIVVVAVLLLLAAIAWWLLRR